MSFGHFNRRLHLYLAMGLLPWFIVYAISSVPFAHGKWFGGGPAEWVPRLDRPYAIEIPAQGDLRPVAAAILRDTGLDGSFGVSRGKGGALQIYRYDFRGATRVTYDPAAKRVTAEDRRFRWSSFLTGLHARGGFEQPGALNHAWGVLVDLVCIALLIWIASGLYMWWHVAGHRGWGWLALGAGSASFAALILAL